MGKKRYRGWSEGGIDKMERLAKEIQVDHGDDPDNGKVGRAGALRDRHWNFENAYHKWTNKNTCAQKSNQKNRGKGPLKECQTRSQPG
jgi:hypothetical protein